jgi:hypothetical protein
MFLTRCFAPSLVALMLSANSASGVVIFDTFKPGDIYDGPGGYNVQHYESGPRWDYAVPIVISDQPMQFDQYVLPLKRRDAGNWIRLELRADDQGLPGDTILEQIDIHDYPVDIQFVDDRPAPVVLASPTRPIIEPGTTVWVALTAPEGFQFGDNSWGTVLLFNSDLLFAQRDTINTDYLWESAVPISVFPALRVTATPVPEPSTIGLFAIGAVGWGMACQLRRLRRIG